MQDRDERGRIEAALKMLAEDEQTSGASSAVEERVLAEVRTIARSRRRRVAGALAIAAALLLAVAVPVWRTAQRSADVAATAPARQAPQAPQAGDAEEGVTAFFPLADSALPSTGARVVRIEVPRAALRSFGVAPLEQPGRGQSPTAFADVLIGEDGLARAVRFVRAAKIQE